MDMQWRVESGGEKHDESLSLRHPCWVHDPQIRNQDLIFSDLMVIYGYFNVIWCLWNHFYISFLAFSFSLSPSLATGSFLSYYIIITFPFTWTFFSHKSQANMLKSVLVGWIKKQRRWIAAICPHHNIF